ncbi:translocation/assembly module TamB domain-containing protein [Phytopseudomonas punonensis]|uniref:Translocation and assembly module TamB n=1 Tax=Phytopseudomonas punonensis TaxID=1220495 RepID=A0A1M7LQ95_9GAMM|nr:translocation/assembly module TamB domain-containing protein [Pseudomonas punonensis]SHM80429.1 translocation and assembly module TamB [Pseudomonas punonensis]
MRRAFKYAGLSFAGLLALLVVLLIWMLATSAGSRWALSLVPGLQVDGFEGRLGGRWTAQQVLWQQGDDQVVVRQPQFDWSPSCLLRLTLCIDTLRSERIELNFAPSTEAPSEEPFNLPQLDLPVALEVGEVWLGSLQLNGDDQLQGLELAADWASEGLNISKLHLQRDELIVDVQGHLQPSGEWPLKLQGSAALPSPDGKAWDLKLQVEGNLRESLALVVDSSGYLAGRLSGEVQPLVEHIPASLTFAADGFKAEASLPDTLRLNGVTLQAAGNLQDGYRINGIATLPAEEGPVALALQGRVDAAGADVETLRLSAGPGEYLAINGRLDWQEGFSADTHIDWQDFPWLRLYPLEQAPPVTIKKLTGDLAYDNGNYLGNLSAALDGPAGAFNVQTPLSGDLQQIHLPQLQVRAGQGKIDGQLTVGFANAVRWDAQLQVSDFDPAYWVAELPGRIAGPVRSKGQLLDGRLELTGDLDLKGHLRGQQAQLQAKVAGAGERWDVSALNVQLGDNRIDGSGQLDQRLQGQLRIALNRLGQLWPGLQGQASGRLDLAGNLETPQGTFALTGQGLAFEDTRLRQLGLNATLDVNGQAKVQLRGQGIASGDSLIGDLAVNGSGNGRQQQMDLSLQGPQLQTSLALDGTLDKGDWRGRLSRAEVQAGGQDWRLQAPASLVRLASGEIDLGAHCLRSGAASLCGENQRLQPEPKIRYRLADFPLDSLSPWFPKDFAWQGTLDADVHLDLPAAGPNGRVVVDAGSGTWRVRDDGQWVDFTYDSLRLSSELRPQRIDSELSLRGPRIGELSVQAQLDPRGESKPLSGQFRLSGLDLAIARPFVPMVERLSGQLNGSGTLSGDLLKPLVNGQLALSDGEVSGGELPTSFEDLQVRVLISGESLQLNGVWRSGDKGQGTLDGALAWSGALSGNLNVKGSSLPVNVEPYANLEVAPDMQVRLANDQLSVSGKVSIPRGKIVVRELPPSTVKVSDDAVIVGAENQEKQPVAISMDIDVDVGSDKLTFSGFGLNAELAGRVHIGDDLDTRGELNLNKGNFRGYGQRLTIRRARLLFAGPIDQPFLDIEAIRKVDDVVAGLRLTGSADQPRTEVFSEPAMSQEQALSYLVLGRPLSTGSEDNNMLAQAALALGVAGSSGVTGSVAQSLGIQDFQLDTDGSGRNTSVVASGNLSERLSLRYGVGVFEPVNTVALRYALSRRLYLEAASGLASSLDLFYKRDF